MQAHADYMQDATLEVHYDQVEGMMGVHKRLLGVVFATLMFSLAAHAQVDVEPYVAENSFNDIKISPTGKYFALSVPVDGQTGLVIMDREKNKMVSSFRFTRDTHVGNFWWVNPERVLISVSDSFGSRDKPAPTGELYAMNADGSKKELLVGWRVQVDKTGTRIKSGKKEEEVAAFMIDPLPDDDRNVLIAVQPFTKDPYVRAERMDVYTGKRSQVARVPVNRADFMTDGKGRVRFAVGAKADNYSQLFYRESDVDEWQQINHERESGRVETPLGFSDDGATAYLRVTKPEGPSAIVAMDVASGERREIERDKVFDPHAVFRDGWGVPVGVRYLGDKPRTAFFDEKSSDARMYRSLEEAFPGQRVEIASSTADGRHKVVVVSSDIDPGSIFLFDTVNKKMDFVLAQGEKINPEKMSPMSAIKLRARDGLDLHGFLTVPKGSTGKGLPMVVVPHGGPFGVFDAWGFDNDAQLLAEAGYAVLQVNYRGSGNHGRAFQGAGAKQWGGTMQDDLTDATRWAIQEGIADSGRICIYGASYGGYAALMGVAKEPDLYRCAAGYVGVYDLPRMRDENKRIGRWATTWSDEWVGGDVPTLMATSPNRLADRIKVPVLLVAGGEDERAPIEHSKSMERALLAAGTPVETLYYPDEGHGFYKIAHKREFYRRLLAFLHGNIGGKQAAGG